MSDHQKENSRKPVRRGGWKPFHPKISVPLRALCGGIRSVLTTEATEATEAGMDPGNISLDCLTRPRSFVLSA
jgi:hypothetical protein